MIALAYGTIPIVHRTGGLADTVNDFNLRMRKGNGFAFRPLTSGNLKGAIYKALKTYNNKKSWEKLVSNAFASDYSWDKSVKEYISLYQRAVIKRTS
jgi:starch synthase